jgi:15-cis-phytoene synthase
MTSIDPAYQHCLASLRDLDRDRYLACLLMPATRRGAMASIYAFNAEIARVRDVVREPMLGEIRLQWWRDVLENSNSSEPLANPLALALVQTIREHHLPVQSLMNLIDARVFDLYDDPIGEVSALEGYAGETASTLLQLGSLILNPTDAHQTADLSGHAGVAQTIAGLLLLMPLHRHRGQVFVPDAILKATGLNRDSFLKGDDRAAVSAAVSAFAGLGRDHLAKARQLYAIPKSSFPAYLPVALVQPVLDRAARLGSHIFDAPFGRPQWRRQWLLWQSLRKARF